MTHIDRIHEVIANLLEASHTIQAANTANRVGGQPDYTETYAYVSGLAQGTIHEAIEDLYTITARIQEDQLSK